MRRIDVGREKARAHHTLCEQEPPKLCESNRENVASPFLAGDALKNRAENVSVNNHPSEAAVLSVSGAFGRGPRRSRSTPMGGRFAVGIELLKMHLQAGEKIPDVAVELREIADCVQHLIQSGLI